jgi:hypothetical protein
MHNRRRDTPTRPWCEEAAKAMKLLSERLTRPLSRIPRAVRLGIYVIATGVLVSGFGLVRFGSARAGWEYLGGDRVILSPGTHSCSVVPRTRVCEQMFVFKVYNCTSEAMTVLGQSSTDCACGSLHGLPMVVTPGGSKPLAASVRFGGNSPQKVLRIRLLTDSPAAPVLMATIRLVARE